jgi:hyperosmotically inducible protein
MRYFRVEVAGRWITATLAVVLVCSTPSLARAGRATPSDWRTAAAVRQRLDLEGIGVDDEVKVEVYRGVVTLAGTVRILAARDRLVGLARATGGVAAVIDRLALRPAERADGDIAREVRGALRYSPALDGQVVSVEAQRGEVTLSGGVRSFVERDLAESLARGVEGVKKVTNRVTVRPPAHRPDAEIERDISARLYDELRVNTAFVTPEVSRGVVRLEGYVADADARELVGLLCWVVGVKRVDSSALRVDDVAAGAARRAGLVIRAAAELERHVAEALAQDPRLRGIAVRGAAARPVGARTSPGARRRPLIVVRALAGVVTLTGEVPSFAAWRAAEQDAGNPPGVVGVVNLMTVDPRGGP